MTPDRQKAAEIVDRLFYEQDLDADVDTIEKLIISTRREEAYAIASEADEWGFCQRHGVTQGTLDCDCAIPLSGFAKTLRRKADEKYGNKFLS